MTTTTRSALASCLLWVACSADLPATSPDAGIDAGIPGPVVAVTDDASMPDGGACRAGGRQLVPPLEGDRDAIRDAVAAHYADADAGTLTQGAFDVIVECVVNCRQVPRCPHYDFPQPAIETCLGWCPHYDPAEITGPDHPGFCRWETMQVEACARSLNCCDFDAMTRWFQQGSNYGTLDELECGPELRAEEEACS